MPKDIKKMLLKANKLAEGKELALAEEFIDIEEKIQGSRDSIEEKLDSTMEAILVKLAEEKEQEKVTVSKMDNLPEELNSVVGGFSTVFIKGEKGENGENGPRGPKGDKGDKGDDGKDYTLTNTDKKEIASMVKVPVVEKVTEIIKEPIYTENIIEKALYENAEDIVSKINELPIDEDKQIDASHIKNLPEVVNRVGFGSMLKEAPKDGLIYGRQNREWVEVTGGGGTWGSITGTLSDQTDLQSALDAKQDTLSLTTTGSSGSSTLIGTTLNIPTYTLSGLGGVPTSRTLTINGTAYDLSADRSWTITGGVATLAAIGSSPNANGATISGSTLNLEPANATYGGIVTTSAQTFAGLKTFNNGIVLGAGTATAGTAPIKLTSGTNLTTAEAGTMEYNGTELFFTPVIRSTVLMTDFTNYNTYSKTNKGATAFTSGTRNFLLGYRAGSGLTYSSDSILIGYQAGTGEVSYANFLGYKAGDGATNANYSNFFGQQSGEVATGANNANFFGQYSGNGAISASHSNFFGNASGYTATNASNSNFFGQSAGHTAINASHSFFAGNNAGRNARGASESIFIGKDSGYNSVGTGIQGSYNIGLGTSTGKALTTGAYNTFIGYQSGDNVTTGSENVLIGRSIDAQSATATGQLSIQNAIFGTGNTGTGTTASTGKIGIYTVAPTCALDVTGGIATSRTAVTAPAATDGNIFSGTYTPTITGVTNVTSSTAYTCQYMRVGKVVTVSGQVAITATTNNAQTTFGMSLPIASNFSATEQCGGGGYTQNNTVAGHGVNISADTTNDRANFDYFETHGGADTFNFAFTYQII